MNNQLVKTNSGLAVSSLSPVDRKAVELLLPTERKIIEAGLLPKINAGEPVNVVTTLIAIISTTYSRAGQQIDDATLALYADELYNALVEKFPRVTIAEVKEALKQGVYGEYGKYYGLNPVTFMNFIKSYLSDEERKEAQRNFENKQLRLSAPVLEPMTQEQKAKDDREFVNYLFEQYRNRRLRNISFPVNAYDILASNDAMPLTADRKHRLLRKAKGIRTKQIFDEITIQRNSKRDLPAGTLSELLDRFANGKEPQEEKDGVKAIAKKLAVLYFFARINVNGWKTIF